VLRAIAKNPADRFPTGAALENALRHWDSPVPSRTGQMATVARQRQAAMPPRTRAAAPRRAGPAAPVRRRKPPPPPPAARRDEVGCATWLIGSALLFGVIGFLVLAFQFGPELFGGATTDDDPTPTAVVTQPAAID